MCVFFTVNMQHSLNNLLGNNEFSWIMCEKSRKSGSNESQEEKGERKTSPRVLKTSGPRYQ